MGADFVRIRREMDKLQPTFTKGLDLAFGLMAANELVAGGDKHHGLMKCIWRKFGNLKKSPWNLVRLPHRIHGEVHALYAAAFVGTDYFLKFSSARVLLTAGVGSYLDAPMWQKRIQTFTVGGVFYVGALVAKYNVERSGVHYYAKKWGLRAANAQEAQRRSHAISTEAEAKIVRWYGAGHSLHWIADTLDISATSVRRRLKGHGKSMRTLSQANLLRKDIARNKHKSEIIFLRNSGQTTAQIGVVFGYTPAHIAALLREWKVPTPAGLLPIFPKLKKQIIQMAKAMTRAEIADQLGVNLESLNTWAVANGIRFPERRKRFAVLKKRVIQMAKTMTRAEIAEQLGMSPDRLRGWAFVNGIRFPEYWKRFRNRANGERKCKTQAPK